MRTTTTILVLAAVSVVGACKHREPLSADFGNSVNQNPALHVVDPQPASAGAGAPNLEGTRAVIGYGRYLTDTVETPVAESTADE